MTVIAKQITQAPNYLHVQPTIPEMTALGRNAPIILANQLVINDRMRPDRYFVKDITGLRGPDLRDSRQPRPAAHGEVLFDSYWGGKTIAVAGTIEAGSQAELNAMERDLVACLGTPPRIGLATNQTAAALEVFAALQSMVEWPMKFNWWDQHDAFFDSQSVAFWSQLSGAALTIAGNGRCLSVGGGATTSYHNLRSGFIDETVTLCAFVQPQTTAQSVGPIVCATASNSYLQALLQYTGSTWQLVIQSVLPSGTTTLATQALSSAISIPTKVWIQLQTLDDYITASVLTQDPQVTQTPNSLATASATLVGSAAGALGYRESGFVGFTATKLDGTIAIFDWRVDAIYPCDFLLNVRTVQSPAMGHAVRTDQGTRFKRDFQFAVRASDPSIRSPVSVTSTIPLLSSSGVYFGFSFPMTFPLIFNVPTSEPTNEPISQSPGTVQQTVVNNRGTWVAYPRITIYGGITNPVLYNQSTGYSFSLDGTIAQGDYVYIDSFNKVMTNSAGASTMGMFDPGNVQWPEIQPGDNVLQFAGSNPVGSPYATISWQYTWI